MSTRTVENPRKADSLRLVLILSFVSSFRLAVAIEVDPYLDQRRSMVELVASYSPSHRVTDKRVLAAMNKIPRHLYVPESMRPHAYQNSPLPIGADQTISQPFIVGYMTQTLELKESDKVLEIGTGSGYQAAVLAEIAREVYTIEILPNLARRAQAVLREQGYINVHVRAGDGYQGWPKAAPFDAIIVTCAPEHIPQALVEQLKVGGRMIIPVGPPVDKTPWVPQELILVRKTASGMVREKQFDVRFVEMTGIARKPAKPVERPPIRSLFGFNPKSSMFRGLSPDKIASRVKKWGVNAVFLPSEEPVLQKVFQSSGIKVFRELACFQGERHWKSHPESRPINSAGQPIRKIKWYAGVCPNQKWLQAELMGKARRMVESGADGIWLDFTRYPAHWEVPKPRLEETCFCPVCLSAFEMNSGLKLPDGGAAQKAAWILRDHLEDWRLFKTHSVTEFVSKVNQTIRAAGVKDSRRPIIGLFAVPWTSEEQGGAITRDIGQDFAALVPHVDVFSPMTYYPLVKRSPEWMVETAEYFKKITSKPVWPIIYAGERSRPLSETELERAIETAGRGGDGVILLSFGSLEQTGRIKVLEKIWGVDP